MKKIKIFIKAVMILIIPFFAACEFEYPEPLIQADLGFAKSGLQVYETNSEYSNATAIVTISRTFGLSKEIEMEIAVDESLVQEYNDLYSSDFQVMNAKYYTLPKKVTFPANTKEINIEVTLNPNAMVADMGYTQANNLLLPIKLLSASAGADIEENAISVLVNPNVSSPLITVEVPAIRTLSFLKTVPLTQDVTLQSLANFNTVDVTKVAYTVDPSKVAVFNTEHNEDHILLPEGYYEVIDDVFDAQTMKMTSVIRFDCSKLDETKTYLLPLTLHQSKTYGITQSAPVYVVVTLTELKIWPSLGDALVKIGGPQGNVELQVNSPLMQDISFNLFYDFNDIAAYNSRNSTNFKALTTSRVHLESGTILTGNLKGNVPYRLDIADLSYDDGNEYLVPLRINEQNLPLGAQVTNKPTAYLKLVKTITGNYAKEELGYVASESNSQNRNSRFNRLIRLANGSNPVPVSTSGKNQKYAINYDTGWSDGLIYFSIGTEVMPGKPGCFKLIDLQDRAQGYDPVIDRGCYFDTNTGNVYFNLSIKGYWSTQEINVRLHTRTDI